MNRIKNAFEPIAFDDAIKERLLRDILAGKPQKRNVLLIRSLAAAAAVLILCVTVIPGLLNNSPAGIHGDGCGNGNSNALRISINSLSDIFFVLDPEAFVFVRILDTKMRVRETGVQEQISTAQINSIIWSRGDGLPETIEIVQSLYGGCQLWIDSNGMVKGCENVNLLRKDGVYMLPLMRYIDWLGGWSIFSEDALFEIDGNNRVQSHSAYRGFNRFDGRGAQSLADAVTAITSDENFPAAMTGFGKSVMMWWVLAEAEVLSVTRGIHPLYEYEYEQYTMRVDSAVSNTGRLRRGETILAETTDSFFEPGRYLMILEPSGNVYNIGPVAKINDDGTITSTVTEEYSCVFEEFNGYTVAQMKELAERAKAWYARHMR
jgi:hypothetical protein